jgi:transposase
MSTNHGNPSVLAAAPYVGIDVSKEKLDLARTDDLERVVSFPNDPAGIARIVELLTALKPGAIVVESTGGLERPLLEALLEANLPASLVHPGRVRYFAIGLGILAKTDPIDARVLAKFAELASPRLSEKRSKNGAELRDLVACRRQLCQARAQQYNRRCSTFSKASLRSVDSVIAAMDKQIEALDRQIRDLIDDDDEFKNLDRLLRSVPGVGPTLSATLLTELRELGQADRRQIGALVGVAPFNADSGPVKGKRRIRGGRTTLRCVLYMGTLAALRFNPIIKTFADRLKAAGKQNKVVISACMRKLMALLNAMVRDNLTWDQLKVVKKLAVNH